MMATERRGRNPPWTGNSDLARGENGEAEEAPTLRPSGKRLGSDCDISHCGDQIASTWPPAHALTQDVVQCHFPAPAPRRGKLR